MTKLKHYLIMRLFAKQILQEISVDKNPVTFIYDAYINGYTKAVIECCDLSKSEAANIRTEAAAIKKSAYEKIEEVRAAIKYQEALEYCKERLTGTFASSKVLHSATTTEIISLYETAWHSYDSCDFYDAYEELEHKYLRKR